MVDDGDNPRANIDQLSRFERFKQRMQEGQDIGSIPTHTMIMSVLSSADLVIALNAGLSYDGHLDAMNRSGDGVRVTVWLSQIYISVYARLNSRIYSCHWSTHAS